MNTRIKRNILVVDDNKNNRDVVSMTLEEAGHRVIAVAAGTHGLEKLKTEKIDLIILELVLAGLDGYGLLTMLKSDPLTKEIPVLVLTGRDSRGEVEEAIKLGAVDCIVRYRLPPAELLKIVNIILKG
ncbi:MAG: response regulator [Candidatus Omnitrophota bacterium]|nr:response regulator [Candidatus Omnitrophota bacterium]MBU1929082.1 response regulator [Candidatus Omnitrophota bacterium]MBU1929167.1 response regulator [Candidatus Omnitrophota bacterium]MBU2035047.1 response regulator [Candidatus Omnitrophota bacterium]MBU2222121.1 response regulator [Candidatus Omnitrophota bacterium]